MNHWGQASVSLQVVMAVAQLYFHLAPKAEVGVIAKALVRLLRSHRYVACGFRCSLTLEDMTSETHGEPQTSQIRGGGTVVALP